MPDRLVSIENITEFRRNLRGADNDVKKAVRDLDKETAKEIGDRVPQYTPELTGRLRRSLKAGADNKGGWLSAGGTARTAVYPSVIHWGFPRRNIKRTGFMIRGMAAFGREYDGDFAGFYLKRLMKVLEDFGETSTT